MIHVNGAAAAVNLERAERLAQCQESCADRAADVCDDVSVWLSGCQSACSVFLGAMCDCGPLGIPGYALLLFGPLMHLIATIITDTHAVDEDWDAATCQVLAAHKQCATLSCTSWICMFDFESTCGGEAVTGSMKKTSFKYNGMGHLKSDVDCLRSVGMDASALGTMPCWHLADSCTSFSADHPDNLTQRMVWIRMVGTLSIFAGVVLLVLDRTVCRSSSSSCDCDCDGPDCC